MEASLERLPAFLSANRAEAYMIGPCLDGESLAEDRPRGSKGTFVTGEGRDHEIPLRTVPA